VSFDALRIKVGRKPISIVELDLDFCQLTYGTSPCTAAIGTTGSAKCYNTFKTCQDPENYDKGTKTYKFCSNNGFLPIGENIYPCITGLDIAPTQLNTTGFSVSASVTVTFQDFPYHDRGIDPYASERTNEGSFFGKLRARNPYLIGRVMRVKTGYVDNDRTVYTQSRTYFIDRMEGPDANGRVRIIGKDILRFADSEKAQAPVQSKGLLASSISNSDVTLTLTPTGIGAEYPSSGTVRIGDEVLTYSGKSGDQLTGLTRGTDGTAADGHDADDGVQLCLRYTAETVPDMLYDLLDTYAGFDTAYMPLSEWADEATTWIGTFTSTVLITEPTGVRDLVDEILESSGSALWWDEIDAELKFKVIVPVQAGGDVPILNEGQHILQGTLTVKDQEKERISRVVIGYGLISPVEDVRYANLRSFSVTVDGDGEGVNAYGSVQSKEILSRFIPAEAVAAEVGQRLLNRYRETPRELTFRLDAKDANLKTGDLVDIQSRLVQGFDGAPATVRFIVVETREVEVGTYYDYRVLQISITGGQGPAALIAPDDLDDWDAASDEDRETYIFISGDDGLMSDGTPGALIS
jgi:hypothetical protein